MTDFLHILLGVVQPPHLGPNLGPESGAQKVLMDCHIYAHMNHVPSLERRFCDATRSFPH